MRNKLFIRGTEYTDYNIHPSYEKGYIDIHFYNENIIQPVLIKKISASDWNLLRFKAIKTDVSAQYIRRYSDCLWDEIVEKFGDKIINTNTPEIDKTTLDNALIQLFNCS